MRLLFLITLNSFYHIRSKRGTLPSVNHDPKNYRIKGEKKSPARRLDRRRSERLIGNYTSDNRYPFSRQPSISEELPTMTTNSSPKHRLERQNNEYTDSDKTIVPEWLRKNPLQLHYINNCDRNRNDLKNRNNLGYSEDDSNSPRKNDSGIFSILNMIIIVVVKNF